MMIMLNLMFEPQKVKMLDMGAMNMAMTWVHESDVLTLYFSLSLVSTNQQPLKKEKRPVADAYGMF